jgi:copper(I)-binding protein
MIKRRDLFASVIALLLGSILGLATMSIVSTAHEYEVGKIKIIHPWIRAPKDGDDKAQFYAVIENNGNAPDKLISVKSEKFGRANLLGDAKTEGPILISPQQKIILSPKAGYIDLLNIKKHLEVGWGLEMVLVFEKAGEVTIDAAIDAPDAMHAHDAEAMARWEKAHGKDTSGPKADAHKDHHNHMQHHDGM